MVAKIDGRLEKGKATRDRLLAAARSLFGAKGYEPTSIEEILAAARVKRGSLYHHFDSKAALFDAVLDQVNADIARRVAVAARAAGPDPAATLRAGCDAWLQMARDPALQRIVLLDAPAVVGWNRVRALDEQHSLGGLRANLRRIARQGRLPAREVDVLARMLLAALGEAALLVAHAPVREQREALAAGKAAVDTLLARLVG